MQLSLYSTTTYALLQRITYEPAGGPAFIWSLEWSEDQSRLVLGCWNQLAYLYAVDTKSTGSRGSEVLTEVCRMRRADRVYAVALDQTGGHVVVGGRDKRVAMFDTDRGEPGREVEPVLIWEMVADDFVYCVALSSDMQYVAFGGTAKKVNVLLLPSSSEPLS